MYLDFLIFVNKTPLQNGEITGQGTQVVYIQQPSASYHGNMPPMHTQPGISSRLTVRLNWRTTNMCLNLTEFQMLAGFDCKTTIMFLNL